MPIIAKLLGSGLGLTSEAIHKARGSSTSPRPSSQQPQDSGPPPAYSETAGQHETTHAGQDEQAHDEAAWELDDMAERVRPSPHSQATMTVDGDSEEAKVARREAMVRSLAAMAGPPPRPSQRLPCPVILPQRRPRQKDRGFVRAYAPVLADSGISQDVFLRFIEDLDAANKASKWLDVIFVAGNAVGFVPSLAAHVTSLVVQVAAGAAREFQGRSRGNTYLDRVNEDVFIPRGLVALVMQFKDDVPPGGGQQKGPLASLSGSIQQTFFTTERLDMNQTAAKYGRPEPGASVVGRGMENMRLTHGKTHGRAELPESAPLIYPDLDEAIHTLAEDGGKSSVKDKLKSAGSWTNDYLDRRAHVFYEAEHGGSSLTTSADSRAPMQSRFNDPNHAANSGSIISLLTGGGVATQSLPQKLAARRGGRGRGRGAGPRSRGPGSERQNPVKKMLQKDVFYLLVVNIPSPDEVQESVAQLEDIMRQA